MSLRIPGVDGVCPMKVKLVRNYFYLTDLMREEVIHRGERPHAPTAA